MEQLPTRNQIEFAELIARGLGIEFPTCSEEFTRDRFSEFIRQNAPCFQRQCFEEVLGDPDEWRT